jgi:hypothetical protein
MMHYTLVVGASYGGKFYRMFAFADLASALKSPLMASFQAERKASTGLRGGVTITVAPPA